MILARQIVNYLRTCSKGELELRWHNLADAVRRPHVEVGEVVAYTPGWFDAVNVKLAVNVKGVQFVKDSQAAMWRPEDADMIFGVGCFVDSPEFLKLGCAIENRHDKAECLSATLKAISGLLDSKFNLRNIYDLTYDDLPYYLYYDFKKLQEALSGMEFSGCYYEAGYWHCRKQGSKTFGRSIVCPSVCAMCLTVGCSVEASKDLVFVKLSKGEFERIREVICGVGGKDLVQKFYKQAKRTNVDRAVYLLLAPDSFTQITTWIMRSDDAESKNIVELFRRKYDTSKRKWIRTIVEEEISIEFNI